MATVPPKELLAQWAGERLPIEMAVGHILQNLVMLQSTNEALKQAVHMLQAQIDNVSTDAVAQSQQRTRKKPPPRY